MALGGPVLSPFILRHTTSHHVETQFLVLEGSLGSEPLFHYIAQITSSSYNILNECSYRVMSVFRMAATDMSSVLKSNTIAVNFSE